MSEKHEINCYFVEPGRPTQNAFVESFKGKFCDECLNESWFARLEEALDCAETWRYGDNTGRPHSCLNYKSPAELRQTALAMAF